MQEYDVALKLLLKGSATLAVREMTGTAVEGGLVHLEVQSGNDPAMPFRMIEYCLGVQRMLGQFPRQILLYVGEAPVNMETELHGPSFAFDDAMIDIRTLDGDRLLESEEVGDNVICYPGHPGPFAGR